MSVTFTTLFFALLLVVTGNAQADEASKIAELPGLKRFDPTLQLGMQSSYDIKGAHTGTNVVHQTIQLFKAGGEVNYITGGSRSRKVTVSFEQPYQDSRLIQDVELRFDKDKGFVHAIRAHFHLASAYLDITPVYQQLLGNALKKYGEPISLQRVADIASSTGPKVRLRQFMQGLTPDPQVKEHVRQYFAAKIVKDDTHFIADDNGWAKLISGFEQCIYWQQQQFSEWLALCSFTEKSGNMRGRGVSLSLTNFAVKDAIERYKRPEKDGEALSF